MFGQVVIGPPGSGKSTYCRGIQDFLKGLKRKVVVINLDPANDALPYECEVCITKLIKLSDVMESFSLGPNGGLIYCVEYLEANVDWLLDELKKHNDCYFIFDCPGQVELYTHHNSVKNIIAALVKFGLRLCTVNLVDSHYCNDPGNFIAVLLTSITTMMQLETPHVNILSKVDLIEKHGRLAFNIDFYTDVLDLSYLLDQLADDPFTKKYKKLNKALCEVIDSYSLVSFLPLNIQEKESVYNVIKSVDKANGYVFGVGEERNIQTMLSTAMGAEFEYFKTANVREKYVDSQTKVESEEMDQT